MDYRLAQLRGILRISGKTKISAQIEQGATVYVIEVENPVLQDGLIVKLAKETGIEKEELRLFKKPARVMTPTSERLIVKVPCTEPNLCTEYISLLLKWLDSTYYAALADIKKFEEPIKV